MTSDHLSMNIPAPVLSAQASFRAVMDATARPGTLHALAGPADAPAPLARGAAALALALFDGDTPVWLDAPLAASPAVTDWLRFKTGAPLTTERARSSFALIADGDALEDLDGFALGSQDYPDRSTTLVLQVRSLTAGAPATLAGPGIKHTATLAATLPAALFRALAATRALFPRGLDLILVAGDTIAAIPRTTRVSLREG